MRFNALKQHRFYIPFGSVVCKHHFESHAWKNIESFRSLNRFDANQIADMIDLLRYQKLPEIDAVQDFSSVDMKINTGLSREKFEQLFESIPSIKIRFNNIPLAKKALHTYMMRLRTGQTLDQISSNINVSHTRVRYWLKTVREILSDEFVPFDMKLLTMTPELYQTF